MITTIIFDLDGLLADTEPLQMQAYQQALLMHGVMLTDDEYARHWIRAGLGIDQFVADHRISIAPNLVRQQKARRYQALLETSLHAMPGAWELLERLYRRKRLAVASASFRDNVEQILRSLDFSRYFDVVAAGDDVEHGKPAPDIFLYTARQLKTEPSECVVIEDAEKGILAAEHAGMKSIAVPNRHTLDNDFSAASYVVNSLSEVERLLELL
ncbi:MAG: HAD family phosphatase [Anaerolineales bacterium]